MQSLKSQRKHTCKLKVKAQLDLAEGSLGILLSYRDHCTGEQFFSEYIWIMDTLKYYSQRQLIKKPTERLTIFFSFAPQFPFYTEEEFNIFKLVS